MGKKLKPQSIRIGPVSYRVVRVEKLQNDSNQDLHGQVLHADCEIRLNTRITPDQEIVTLWHEVLHCYEGVYGLELTEEQITLLAPLIVQSIRDNEALCPA